MALKKRLNRVRTQWCPRLPLTTGEIGELSIQFALSSRDPHIVSGDRMSHIVRIQTQVKEAIAARAACQRLKLEPPIQGTAELFSGEATGLIVKLPDWRYPVVFNTGSGEAKYDNYNGRWGEQTQLDHFLQAYAVEKTKIEARRKGHAVTEQPLADGSIKLTVNVGGAA